MKTSYISRASRLASYLTLLITSPAILAVPIVTFYTDEASFNAVTNTTLIDFESVTTGGSSFGSNTLTIDGVSFTTSSAPGVCGTGCVGNPFDSFVYASGNFQPVTISLAGAGSGFTAAGGFFGELTHTTAASISISGNTGLLSSHSLTVGDIGAGLAHTFFGWTVSGDEILQIDYNVPDLFEAIDDFRFGTTNSVPEPTTLLLLGLGLAGLGFTRRRLH